MSAKKMRDNQKTKAELLQEVKALRSRVAKLTKKDDVLRLSDHKWYSLLKNTPDIVMIVDRDGTIRFINHTVPGITVREAIGKKIYDYISPEHHDKVRRDLEQIFQSGQGASHEVSVVRRHGALSWYQAELGPIRQNECIVAASIVARDITGRRRAEDALRESEEGFREFFENVTVGVYRTTPDGQILMANPALVHMLGYSSFEDLSQRNLEEEGFEPQYPRSKFKEEIEREGRIVSAESTWITRDGKKLYVIENARVVRDEDGKVLYYEGTAENITERKRAEEMLRLRNVAIESSINGVVFADIEGNIIYANESFLKMWGYSDEKQVLGKHSLDFWADVSRAAEIREVVNNKGGWTGELVAKAKNGSTFDVQVSASLVKDENAHPVCMMASFIDITDRKNTEQSLRESEERLRVALSAAQMGTWRWDPVTNQDTRDASWNGILGLEAIESTQPVDDFLQRVHPEDRDMVDREIQRSLREHRTYVAEFRIIRPDGTVRWLRDQGKPLYDENGHILYLTGAVVDITEVKRAEIELNEFREKMSRAERLASLGTLSATLAHELNQPLTAIRLSIENSLADLEMTSCNNAVVEGLKDGLSAVSDVASKVNIFRDFAQKSSEEIISEVNLKVVAERIFDLLNESALRAKVKLHLKGLKELPPINSNEKDLEQLFFALVENAIQAADGKKSHRLIISGDVKDKHIELRFTDDCCGIVSENLDKIFEPFFTTRPAGEGTGLGLCIVERIVSGAGGKVRVESKAGKGSTFFVTLPIKRGGRS